MHPNTNSIFSAETKARMAADMVKAEKNPNPEYVGSRAWDALFEMGDGSEVVGAFLKLYGADPYLQAAVRAYDRYIGIDNWLNDPRIKDDSEPSRAEGIAWIKWYRNKYHVSLMEAKQALDARRADATCPKCRQRITFKNNGFSCGCTQRPAIVIYTNAGTFEGAVGTIDADIAVVDFDTDGGREDFLMNLPDGQEIYLANFRTRDTGINEVDRAVIEGLRKRNREE